MGKLRCGDTYRENSRPASRVDFVNQNGYWERQRDRQTKEDRKEEGKDKGESNVRYISNAPVL